MRPLSSYLNDHVAGSLSALEMLDHLVKTHQGQPLEKFFVELRADVVADQKVLRGLIQRLKVDESAFRKAGAWISEKFARARLKTAGEKPGDLGLVQALEILVLGITGKQLLWRALSASLGESPLLKGVNLTELEDRAIAQIERVEARRLDAARESFLR